MPIHDEAESSRDATGFDHDTGQSMKDLYEPPDETRYECLECGHEETVSSYPGDCPDCGVSLRNLGTPIE